MEVLLLYLATGALAGLLAGLFGIGGGIVVVPLLLVIFGLAGTELQGLSVHVAVASSMVTVGATAAFAAFSHWRRHAVDYRGFALLAPGLMLGALLGPALAGRLSGEILSSAIGVFILLVAVQTGLRLQPKTGRPLGAPPMFLAGSGIGLLSALFGIGGGALLVPWLHWTGRKMHIAVGTSSVCTVVVGLSGGAAYALSQPPVALGGQFTGYIYWPAVAGIVLASIPVTGLGVYIAHKLKENHLRLLFACYLFLAGSFLIGRNWSPS